MNTFPYSPTRRGSRLFTLIEMVVVVLIIGIVSTVAATGYVSISSTARKTALKSSTQQTSQILQGHTAVTNTRLTTTGQPTGTTIEGNWFSPALPAETVTDLNSTIPEGTTVTALSDRMLFTASTFTGVCELLFSTAPGGTNPVTCGSARAYRMGWTTGGLSLPGTVVPSPGLTELDIRWLGTKELPGVGGSSTTLLGRWPGGGNNVWLLQVDTVWNEVVFFMSENGSTTKFVKTAFGTRVKMGQLNGIRVVWRANNGSGQPDVRFFYSDTDGKSWALLGTHTTNVATTLHNPPTAGAISSQGGSNPGYTKNLSVWRNGTEVARYDAATATGGSYVDVFNNTWAIGAPSNSKYPIIP